MRIPKNNNNEPSITHEKLALGVRQPRLHHRVR